MVLFSAAEEQAVRQRFVPAAKGAGEGKGANWSALHQFSEDKPGILMLMAHAGVGDSFPVQEEKQPKLFEVAVKAGDDDRLLLELIAAEGKQKLELKRDAPQSFEIGGRRYMLSYPSVTVGPGSPATTGQAMIILNQFPQDTVSVHNPVEGLRLYSMKFNGGGVGALKDALARAFPKDNFVIASSIDAVRLPEFEIRHVRLAELARSIAFLSEGALTVEAVEQDGMVPGNLWRFGGPAALAAPVAMKMRAIAAPHLFAPDERFNRLLDGLAVAENKRLRGSGMVPNALAMPTRVDPLSDQKVFVLTGSEDGIAGIESLIRACEQVAAAEDSKLAEAIQREREEELNREIERRKKWLEDEASKLPNVQKREP